MKEKNIWMFRMLVLTVGIGSLIFINMSVDESITENEYENKQQNIFRYDDTPNYGIYLRVVPHTYPIAYSGIGIELPNFERFYEFDEYYFDIEFILNNRDCTQEFDYFPGVLV